VNFVAINCATIATASLGLVDNLIEVETVRYSSVSRPDISSWTVQAELLRGWYEWWMRKAADVSREWRFSDWLWTMMERMHESDMLVDWMYLVE